MAATGRAARSHNGPISTLPYAGLQLRIVAFVLDSIVLFSCFMLFAAAGGLQALLRSDFGEVDPPESAFYVWVAFILAFIPLAVLYPAVLWTWRGQTVGQMAVHIQVLSRHGYRLSFGRALLRTLVRGLSILPLGLGMATVFFDGERRALHDYIAGSVVLELP